MKNKLYPRLLVIASLFVCTTTQANLIGDTITISLQSPLGTSYFSTDIVVQAGTGDLVTLDGLPLVADFETSSFKSVNISTVASILFPNTGGFNGIVVSGIDQTINHMDIRSTLVGLDDSRLTFDAHSFSVDLRDIPFPATDGLIDVSVNAWCSIYIPDSGSSAGLLAVGVLGLATVARRFGRKQ